MMARNDDLLFGLDERELYILSRRFGSPSETLDQIGTSLGVTRERVRQIEQSALRRLRVSDGYRNATRISKALLEANGYITSETVAASMRKISSDISSNVSLAIGSMVASDLRGVRGQHPYPSIVIRDWQMRLAIGKIQRVVDEEVMREPDCTSESVAAVIGELPEFAAVSDWAQGAVAELWRCLRQRAEHKLAERRRSATADGLAQEVLEDMGRPLHWRVVAEEVNRRRGQLGLRLLAENGIHKRLTGRKDLFSYADQGTYGLREWGDDVPYIRQLIKATLESAGKPLTKSQIANEARKVRDVKESSLSMYLDMHPDFYRGRSGKYGLPAWLDPHPTIGTSRDYVQHPGERQKRLNSAFATTK